VRLFCRLSNYAAEVQSVLRPKAGGRVLANLVGITIGSPFPDIEYLAVNSPLVEHDAISLTFFAG
jgi:hypothetical protein